MMIDTKIDDRTPMICHSSETLGERYYEMLHPSGLRVLVCPKDLSTYHAAVGVGYGSVDVPPGEDSPLGVAHFLEHKLFEGEDGSGGDQVFSALGADTNAYTSSDRTVYLASCTGRFDEVLAELLRMVSSLTVTEESVARERDIIAEEIRMNADSPFERCYAEMLRALYHTHRIREEICGSEASIRAITPEVLRRHYAAYYTWSNAVLAVSGRVKPEEVLAVVDACLPRARSMPECRTPPTAFDEPPTVRRSRVTARMQVAKPLFCIGVKDTDVLTDPRALLRRDLCMTVLCEMLFSQSGDFYSALFESGRISPGFSYGSSVGRGYAYYALSGEADDPDAIYRSFCDYVAERHRTGLSREDFDRSRHILYADYVTGFDSTEDIAGSLCNYALDGLDLYEFLDVAEAMTFEDVCRLFAESFQEERYVLSVIMPLDDDSPHEGEDQDENGQRTAASDADMKGE